MNIDKKREKSFWQICAMCQKRGGVQVILQLTKEMCFVIISNIGSIQVQEKMSIFWSVTVWNECKRV